MCECCNVELDFLDTVSNKIRSTWFQLYICHNEECEEYGTVYNNQSGHMSKGDPSGLYR